MRFGILLRNMALGCAVTSFAAAGAAWAESPATSEQLGQMVGATAQLNHKLDANSAHSGEMVEARLSRTVKTTDGTKLSRGTELMGTVDQVQASNGNGSSLSLVFTQAKLPDGRVIPVKVMVIGAYPSDQGDMQGNGTQAVTWAPRHITSRNVDQDPGVLHNIAMTSSISSRDSATFRTKNGDLKLGAGMYLQVAIAPSSGNSPS